MSGRVVVGFAPTPAGYQALRYAVAQACDRKTPLVVVRAVRLDSYESWADARLSVTVDVTAQVSTAFQEALGGLPVGLDVRVAVDAGRAEVILGAVASQPDDLLVLGACTRRRLSGLAHGVLLRRTLRSALCPVVVVPPPAMARIGSATRLGKDTVAELERYLRQPVQLST